MKRLVMGTAAAAATMALAAPGAVAAGSDSVPCWTKGTTTVAASAQIRVYQRGHRSSEQQYACLTRNGKTWRLGRFTIGSTGPGVTSVLVNGRFVAFEYAICSTRACDFVGVRVLDTKTGRTRRSPRLPSDSPAVSDVVLSRKGVAGYRATLSDEGVEVHVFDSAGDRVVDTGAGIAGGSLAFGGETLYWLKDGVARSI